jgi:hypothetical protein
MTHRNSPALRAAARGLLVSGALAVASVASTGCSKKDEKAAAADAAPEAAADTATAVVAADAAAAADAAVADAAVAPLATAVAPRPAAKPKFVDPPICAMARSAKQRKAPTAAALEQRCVEAGGVM